MCSRPATLCLFRYGLLYVVKSLILTTKLNTRKLAEVSGAEPPASAGSEGDQVGGLWNSWWFFPFGKVIPSVKQAVHDHLESVRLPVSARRLGAISPGDRIRIVGLPSFQFTLIEETADSYIVQGITGQTATLQKMLYRMEKI
eukprot:GHVT01009702.1.p1 GENE.GHVT01009702.1~~GHVT01009702.1.p1  ORF type:complete len:143 (-),score=12.01 GHVT01009702.1:979-1407(-)